MREFDFEPLPHWDLGPALDIIDFERGVKLAGTRFYILKAMGARLYRALITWLLDVHTTQHGYTEIYPPFMVREEAMVGSAQFPKFRDVVYFDAESQLYMLPTAEVAMTNMHRDEILDEADLPLYYVAHTPCFRREKMSAGRDVRGIKRVHQFEKVELYKFTTPETSYAGAGNADPRRPKTSAACCRFRSAAWKSSPATWASRPPRNSTWKCGRPAARNGSKSAHAATPRSSRRAAPTSATARPTAASRVTCTRSTAAAWARCAR